MASRLFRPIKTLWSRLTTPTAAIHNSKERHRNMIEIDSRVAQFKAEFMSSMRHEVRTPMTGLLGMLELLLETELKDDQREFAETAFSSAHNLLEILDNIFDSSKIETGSIELEAKPQKQPVTKPVYVLVADDNKINQQIVNKALQLENINVDIAKDGEEALSFFTKKHYDLVLMDVHMPLVDGLEATRIIRAMDGEASRVPIIALTGSTSPHEKQQCLEAGMSAVLGKPFSVDELRAEIYKWLALDGATSQRTS